VITSISPFQLRSEGFCWRKFNFPYMPLRLAHSGSGYGEDARILLDSVIYLHHLLAIRIICINCKHLPGKNFMTANQWSLNPGH